ncbi:MAG: hypothetical protein ACJASV_000260 [Pseudorhodobacter sp.]|jgi:hypothetical protein
MRLPKNVTFGFATSMDGRLTPSAKPGRWALGRIETPANPLDAGPFLGPQLPPSNILASGD